MPVNPVASCHSAAPRRGTQDQAACCFGRSDLQTKSPHLTNSESDSVAWVLLRAPADRALARHRDTSGAGIHPTRVMMHWHAHYCMVQRESCPLSRSRAALASAGLAIHCMWPTALGALRHGRDPSPAQSTHPRTAGTAGRWEGNARAMVRREAALRAEALEEDTSQRPSKGRAR